MLLELITAVGFIFFCLLSFTLPGLGITKLVRLEVEGWLPKFGLSSAIGMGVFTISAYLLAFLHLRFLIWLFPLAGLYVLIKNWKQILANKSNLGIKKPYLIFFWLVLIIGVISQVSVNAFSGLYNDSGLYFYSSHGHDGLWHLSLMTELKRDNFPFQNPELAGHQLQNYHFFVDLLMSETTRMIPFSSLDIYFRFMPFFFSIVMGLVTFYLVTIWTKKQLAGIWSMIFIYFSGSFGYLLTIPRAHNLSGETLFWVSQTPSILGNPPHAAAFILMLAFLALFYQYLAKPQFRLLLLTALIGGITIEFKVYAGTLILGGLLVGGVYQLIFKRSSKTLALFGLTLLVSMGVYLPNSLNSQDFLIWQPWWPIRTMVVAPDRLNWLDLELRRQTYISDHNYKRVVYVETIAFLIFVVGNLGTRFIGLGEVIWSIKKRVIQDPFLIVLLSMTLASITVPILFVQKGVAWNVIQFCQYFLLLSGLFAGIWAGRLIGWIKSKTGQIVVGVIIILLSVPTQIGLLNQFYSNKPLSKITYPELAVFNYLKTQTDPNSIVLTAPFNPYLGNQFGQPPIPIYVWYDTGYVSAFSERRTLIADQEQVGIMGYQVDQLIKDRQTIFETTDPTVAAGLLTKYHVNYIFLTGQQTLAALSTITNIQLVYQNADSRLFKVNE